MRTDLTGPLPGADPLLPGQQNGANMDRAATVTSAVCAVHCALAPLVLPLLPLAVGHIVGPSLEWGFTLTSIVPGVASLGHSYRALHRSAVPLAWFLIGITVLLPSKLLDERAEALELSAVASGASCIILAHILNLRLRRRGALPGRCACPCHDE